MYISLSHVDAVTKILCNQQSMQNGPEYPLVKGFAFVFDNSSIWPIQTTETGIYINIPLLYGTCDDDADISVAGVVSIYTAEEFESIRLYEHQSRQPFASWIGDIETMSWESPMPYPNDGDEYYWNEPTIAWIKRTQVEYI